VIGTLRRLWQGQIGLGQAFWRYAVAYGGLAALVSSGAALAIIVAKGPILLAAAVYLLPVPYNITAAVGVWRSADRYRGPPEHARSARIAAAIWAVVISAL